MDIEMIPQSASSVESILEKNSGLSNWKELLLEASQYHSLPLGALVAKALYNTAWSKLKCIHNYRGVFTPEKKNVELAEKMLEMANYAYGEESAAPPMGFVKLAKSEVPSEIQSAFDEKTGFLKCEKIWGDIGGWGGFRVEAWLGKRESDSTMIVAFAGTHNASQIALDAWQIFVASGCYLAGAGLLNMLMAKNPSRKFYVVGHSLGGGLTQFSVAANMSQTNASRIIGGYTFNPAGLSLSSLNCIGDERLKIAKDKIYAFETASDPVSAFFGVLGSIVDLPKTDENGHCISALRKCMKKYSQTYSQFTDGVPITSSTAANYKGNAIYRGETLHKNDYIASINRKCFAIMECDDNFSVYGGKNEDGSLVPFYMSNTYTGPKGTGAYLAFQDDGIICLKGGYLNNKWSLPTSGACTLRMGGDGDLVAYSNTSNSGNLFSSNSHDLMKKASRSFAVPMMEKMDGVYEISCYNASRVLTVENNSKDENARIVIAERDSNKTDNLPSKQRFTLTSLNDDAYRIYTVSGKVVGVKNDSCNDRDEIVQVNCDENAASQKWHLIKRSDGCIKFVNEKSEKCLDVIGGRSQAGTRLCLYRDNGVTNQKFTLNKIVTGAAGRAIQFQGEPEIYFCTGDTLQKIITPHVYFEAYKNDQYIIKLSSTMKRFYTYGENVSSFSFIRDDNTGEIFLLVNKKIKYWIPSIERYNTCQFSWDDVRNIPRSVIDTYKTGEPLY